MIDDIADAPVLTYNARFVKHMMQRWQERMKIRVVQQHAATADVVALAQMLQTLLAYCEDVGITTLNDLERAQNARVWLRG